MKFLPLVWKNLWRRKIRTIVHAAVDLHRVPAVRPADDDPDGVHVRRRDRRRGPAGADPQGQPDHAAAGVVPAAAADRPGRRAGDAQHLVRRHLPGSAELLRERSRSSPSRSSKIYPEFKLPPDQMKAWLADRQGAIVGRDLAARFGWKIGDRVPLTATIWQPKSGGQTWEFNIVGIYDGDDGVDKTQFFFRYDYLDENRARRRGTGRLVHREDRRSVAGGGAEPHVRRDVRELVGRDQDHDRKGIRRGLRQADRRHRRDHDRDPRPRCCSPSC